MLTVTVVFVDLFIDLGGGCQIDHEIALRRCLPHVYYGIEQYLVARGETPKG